MDDKERKEKTPQSLVITRASNGFIIDNDGELETFVIERDDSWRDGCVTNKAEIDALIKLLTYVHEEFASSTSRYSKHRVYIVDRPGDKNDAFTNKDSEVLFATEDNPPKDPEVEVFDDEEK